MSAPSLASSPSLVRLVDVTCGIRRSRAGAERLVPLHEFVFVRRGVFQTHLHRRVLTADPNQVLLVDGGSEVRFSHPTDDGDEFTAIELFPDAARELCARQRPQLADRLRTPMSDGTHPVSHHIVLQLQRMRSAMRRGDALAQEELALALAAGILDQRTPERKGGAITDEPAPGRRDLVEEVKVRLASSLGESLSLGQLARMVGRSPFHLARTFRDATGVPLYQYRLGLRLAVALDRVAEGETNLSALALDLGFSSHSHFTRHFRRRYGGAPTRLRGMLQVATPRGA
ncbi:MAG: AraC family transcriptional regulator [Gemmatimonadaceae bacterium]